jgi:signal transduction histidine kinase
VIETTVTLAIIAPVLAALAIVVAIVDHLRAPDEGDWWFVGSLAAFVIAAIPFSPFGFHYDSPDLPYFWRLATGAIVLLPTLLLRVVVTLTGRGRRIVLGTHALTGFLLVWLLTIPTFPGPAYEHAPWYYSVAFAVFALLYLVAIGTAIVLLARAVRQASGPARVRGNLLLATFVPLGVLTFAWLVSPTESTEFIWSTACFLVSMPFWLAVRAPRGVFQMLAREPADPTDGIARLVRSQHVRADLPAVLESTLRAWGLLGVLVIDEDERIVEAIGIPPRATSSVHGLKRLEFRGLSGGVRVVLLADALSPTLRPQDRATLELLATSIQLGLERQAAAEREHAVELESAAAAETLELANERLEQATELRDRFVNAVAQELRNPVARLLGLSRTTGKGWHELPQDQLEPLQHLVARQGERIATVVERLLLVSSIESGTLRATPERLDLRELVQSSARDTDVDHVLEFETPGDEANLVHAESLAVRAIVASLLENARQYGEPPIIARAQRIGDEVLLEIVDHGSGVRAEFEPQLFERFTRDVPASEPGTGLGLALVRELAHAQSGSVGYHRDTDGRSVFWVRLPSAAPVSAEAVREPAPIAD